jgi:signal transduction histidine kinase
MLRADNLDEAAARITSQVELMRRHVDYHMARARAAAARGVPGVGTPVALSVAGLTRTLERLHAERALEILVDVPSQHRFGGEREDLDEMLGNLMDNACKWARHRVRVTSGALDGARLVLKVEDDGPGLPPGQREAALAPGVRLDESVPGAGLGLAVVRDLAQLYGGALELGGSDLGGLKAELRLPAAPA